MVRRVPLFSNPAASSEGCGGGSSSSNAIVKPFQRPMLQRRAYGKHADHALKSTSLGPKRRMNGMQKLLARAGKGLSFRLPSSTATLGNGDGIDEESDDDDDNPGMQPDMVYVPLQLWMSPHQGGPLKGLPMRSYVPSKTFFLFIFPCEIPLSSICFSFCNTALTPLLMLRLSLLLYSFHVSSVCYSVTEIRPDEYGVEEEVTVLKPAPIDQYGKNNVIVPEIIGKWLRPHQREGVQFMYECVMGLKEFKGRGVILADGKCRFFFVPLLHCNRLSYSCFPITSDMGLGKTLQSVTLIYTLLKTGITAAAGPTAKRIIVVCPCSLVKNWDNEFIKWLGPGVVKTLALAEGDRKTIEKNIDCFVNTKLFNVLIASYECLRTHVGRLIKKQDCCDMLICDEAHRLKNNESQTSKALDSIPVQRRVLLTGTPMQNDLEEYYAMANFTNPGILGTQEDFRRRMMLPILRGREPDATESQKKKMLEVQSELSSIVDPFMLRRTNTLNAQHLPPKLVQVVCCNLTDIQKDMYNHLCDSKATQHILEGKQVNCLGSIQMLMKLSNHPSLVVEEDPVAKTKIQGRRAASAKPIKYNDDDKETVAAPGADGISKFLPFIDRGGSVHPEWSGKMYVLWRLMKEMRKPGNGNDKIVIISNFTQTLDLIGRMCRENSWGFCRLDGSVTMKKRQKMVDEFNDPQSPLCAFLLSSKAGGWYDTILLLSLSVRFRVVSRCVLHMFFVP
jgi:DNA repair and recombination protein RAD54 and RAD54-like protein